MIANGYIDRVLRVKFIKDSTYISTRDEFSARTFIQELADKQDVQFVEFFKKFARYGNITKLQAKIFALHHGFGNLGGEDYGKLPFVAIVKLLNNNSKNGMIYDFNDVIIQYNMALKSLADTVKVLINKNEKILSPEKSAR